MRFNQLKRKFSWQVDDDSPTPESSSSVASEQQAFRLLDLPPELLSEIFRHLDIASAYQARLTCTLFIELAEPIIYESFRILHGADAVDLSHLLQRDLRRAGYLQSVLVSTPYGDDSGLENFPMTLLMMRNLKELILETPDCNSKQPEDRISWVQLQKNYERIFHQSTVAIPRDRRVLPDLESCTMHFVDEVVSLYPLTKYSSIFLHPTLKNLTLSCACTDTPEKILADYREYQRCTALERLHLEECDIEPDSLEVLLSFPTALKSLKLSEGIRYDDENGNRRSRMHGNANPGLLSRAISNATGHSLEHLSLSLGYQRRDEQRITTMGHYLDLTSMTKLKRLDVSISTLRLLLTRQRCEHSTYRRLPSSLETLRVFSIPLLTPFMTRRKPRIPFRTCLIEDKAGHGVPNLQHVIWTYEYQAPGGRRLFGLARRHQPDLMNHMLTTSKEYVVDWCNKTYPVYHSKDVRLSIECDITPPGYIPPYLFPEDKPTTESLWDSLHPPLEAQLHLLDLHQSQQQALSAKGGIYGRGIGSSFPLRGSTFWNAIQTDSMHSPEEEDEVEELEDQLLIPQAQDLLELIMLQNAPPR